MRRADCEAEDDEQKQAKTEPRLCGDRGSDRDEYLPTVHGFDEFFGNLVSPQR
jgi:hypothetical protein